MVVVLLLFGGAKLPKLARSFGEAAQELKKGMAESHAATTPTDGADSPVTLTKADHEALVAAQNATVTISKTEYEALLRDKNGAVPLRGPEVSGVAAMRPTVTNP